MATPLTVGHLVKISENPDPQAYRLKRDFRVLVREMRKGRIDNKKRIASFWANVSQETDRLKTLEEYGDEAYFRSFLGGQWRYHGRGYLMNTWQDAYELLSDELGVDLIDDLNVRGDEMDPDRLEKPQLAAKAAVWFWTKNGINRYADAGNFRAVCSIINRGQVVPTGPINGWDARVHFYQKALSVLPDDLALPPEKKEPTVSDPAAKLKEDADKAISFGTKLIGAPYGTGWRAGTWPDLSPLYARITSHAPPSYYREREIVCSALINVLRFEILNLPATGRKQGDAWPGGTAAIGRHLAFAPGSKPYPPVENTPRGWLVWSPYLGPELRLQGHVGVALGNGYVLEARVPALSRNRTEDQGSRALVAGGGKPYTRIIPPSLWLRK